MSSGGTALMRTRTSRRGLASQPPPERGMTASTASEQEPRTQPGPSPGRADGGYHSGCNQSPAQQPHQEPPHWPTPPLESPRIDSW